MTSKGMSKTGVDWKRRSRRRLHKKPTEDTDDSGCHRCSVRVELQKKGERVSIIQQRVAKRRKERDVSILQLTPRDVAD